MAKRCLCHCKLRQLRYMPVRAVGIFITCGSVFKPSLLGLFDPSQKLIPGPAAQSPTDKLLLIIIADQLLLQSSIGLLQVGDMPAQLLNQGTVFSGLLCHGVGLSLRLIQLLQIILVSLQIGGHGFNIIIITVMQDSYTYTVVKFDQSQILLQHQLTRKLYTYGEKIRDVDSTYQGAIVLKAEPLGQGFIYERVLGSLAKQVAPRFNCQKKVYFEESELYNTFEPVLEYLQEGHLHGGISLETILVDQGGNIRLKDPRLVKTSPETTDDYACLAGQIIKCCLLKNGQSAFKQITKAGLTQLLSRYSNKFIASMWILLKGAHQMRRKVKFNSEQVTDKLLKKQIEEIEKLRKVQKSIKSDNVFKSIQEKKIVVIPPLNLQIKKNIAERKINFSGKKATTQNQNLNQQSNIKSTYRALENMEKTTGLKSGGKNAEIRLRYIKLSTIENFKTPAKRKGKTADKKAK